jgi:hypothetical protein
MRGHVLADGTHAGGVFKLAGGLLEAQVERFLLQRNRAVAQLVGGLAPEFVGFHAVFLFSITRRPPLLMQGDLEPGGSMINQRFRVAPEPQMVRIGGRRAPYPNFFAIHILISDCFSASTAGTL